MPTAGRAVVVEELRNTPTGRVRVVAPRLATKTILAPKLGEFARQYPGVVLDITTEEGRMDLVAGGYDAGIQFGEYIARDMIAVRVSHDHRPAILGSKEYLKSRPQPKTPRELVHHRCINFRHGSEGLYRLEFDKRKQSLSIAVDGPLIVDDTELVLRAALDGVGLAFVAEQHAEPHLTNGTFVRVLQDWCPPFPGYFLYYPSRRLQPVALSALIETLRC
jgi:DNA-binding transcriptional LysR family regulator